LTKTGRLLVALKTGLFLFDTAAATFKLVASLGDVGRVSRFNDGKVSPDGRFFVGTMDESYPRQATASLYRFDPDGSFTKLVEGLTVSNGLAWSPDGRVMYHSDSRQQVIWTYDYDLSSGAISNGREMARPTEEIGRPDGAATDMEGYYWSAGVSSGCVNRYRPDGTIERSIRMPCPAPTMPCFGGPDLKTVYVTSLRRNLGPDVLAAFPLSGSLFSFEAPAPGVEIPRFDDRHFA
jgi:sugar lactone lactonase YvrE